MNVRTIMTPQDTNNIMPKPLKWKREGEGFNEDLMYETKVDSDNEDNGWNNESHDIS